MEFHWIITLTSHTGGKAITSTGEITLPSGTTRSAAFLQVLQHVAKTERIDVSLWRIGFFALEPNRLVPNRL